MRVLRLQVTTGSDAIRRVLMWRLCQELRTSDLIASDGKNEFRILLTSPDAENAEAIADRIGHLTGGLNEGHGGGEELLSLQVELEPLKEPVDEGGPCDPCDDEVWERGFDR